MTEDLKALIEKIQREGVQAAEEKAKSIEHQATLQAQSMIDNAGKESQKLLASARQDIDKAALSAETALKQAARDLLISLRKEINAMLDRIITLHIRKTLNAQELSKILSALIKEWACATNKGNIVIALNKADAQTLEESFLNLLQAEVKSSITLIPSHDIQAGFKISYDSGKSCYDFTDKALAEYLSHSLEPRVAEILQQVVGKNT